MHKFFKCVVCSALFTSEEAFERHKELHPSVLLDQGEPEQKIPSNRKAMSQVAVMSERSESGDNMNQQDRE